MPTCNGGYCWYLVEKVYDINDAQLAKLKTDVPANARAIMSGAPASIVVAAPLFSS